MTSWGCRRHDVYGGHLVQQTTAEYLEQQLGWESIYAYNNEDCGPDCLLGRATDRDKHKLTNGDIRG